MHLRTIEPGLFTTVQDLGRPAAASLGVPVGGAADLLSLRIGNRLLGNAPSDAALECTALGPTFAFDAPALICLAGAAAPDAQLATRGTNRPVARWSPTVVAAGATLRIGRIGPGLRLYLCIAGGVRTPQVLGSRSVHAPSGIGGGPLRAGDLVPIGTAAPGLRVAPLDRTLAAEIERTLARRTLRVVPGVHHDTFPRAGLDALAALRLPVDARSDRMGVRLAAAIPGEHTAAGRSEGMVPGAVQIPPDGRPILLGVDGPTVGGYTTPASVIAADLPALAQVGPAEDVRFEWVTLAEAHAAMRTERALIDRCTPGVVPGAVERTR